MHSGGEFLESLASRPHNPATAESKDCVENSEHLPGPVVLPKQGHSFRVDLKHPVELKFCRTCAVILERKRYGKGKVENFNQFLKRQYCSRHCRMLTDALKIRNSKKGVCDV